jgi:NAD(P)-dependent dehydrogenase (short-subunit alcohol dehydrogenase family)
MVAGGRGLVIEVTDGHTARYRGSFFYDIAKATVIRLAQAQAAELAPRGLTAVALTPGFLRSEAMLDHLGVTTETWREASDPHFSQSETPAYLGQAVVALAGDPDVQRHNGRALATGPLAHEYGFTDADGTQPDFPAYWARELEPEFGPLGEPL